MEQTTKNNKLKSVSQKGDGGYRAVIFAQIGRNGNGGCDYQVASSEDIKTMFNINNF